MWAILLRLLLQYFISPLHSGLRLLQKNGRETQNAVSAIKWHASTHFKIYQTGRADFRICAVNAMNGKKIVQFHLTAAGTTWKRIEGDPLFEHAMLNLLGSALLIPHRSVKSQNPFTGYNQQWETYCILSQGVLPMFQFNIFRKAYTQKGLAMTPAFREVPNLPIMLATWCEELTHWKKPWCWERLRAGGEGDDRGWDGWMASLTRWTWVWVNSRS